MSAAPSNEVVRAIAGPALVALACGALAGACTVSDSMDVEFTEAEWAVIESLSPLPEPRLDPTNAHETDPHAQELGRALFFERSHAGAIITADDGSNGGLGQEGETGKVGCADCHMPEHWFHDVRSVPNSTTLGVDWTPRNTPSIVNAIFYDWYSWSGGAETMWQEAIGATLRHSFQGSSRLAVAHMLFDQYRAPYEAIFGPMDERLDPAHRFAGAFPATGSPGDPAFDGMAWYDKLIVNRMVANYGKAIAAYARLLVSRNAPFDRFVAGDPEAISLAAKRGLTLFIGKAGCIDCHHGPLLSDDDFHNLGVPQEGERVPEIDSGRYDAVSGLLISDFSATGAYSDDVVTSTQPVLVPEDSMRGQFRTKSLRQVAMTAPYMHTGGFATLEDVIAFYNQGGGEAGFSGEKDELLGPLDLSEKERADLAAFLQTLTGEPVDPALLAPP
jgi:cytochrome c peroxidase